MKKILVLIMFCALQSGYCLQNFNSIMKVENTVAEKLNIPVDGPSGIAIHENTAYVCNYRSGILTKINLLTNQVEDEFTDPRITRPYNIILDPTGRYAYIANLVGSLIVFDTQDKTFARAIEARVSFLTFGESDVLWSVCEESLGKWNITDPMNPDLLETIVWNNSLVSSEQSRCIVYDERNGNKNVVIGGVGEIWVYNTQTEQKSVIPIPDGINQFVRALCFVGDKLYYTLSNLDINSGVQSRLGYLNTQYEVVEDFALGKGLYALNFDQDKFLYITDFGVVIEPKKQKTGGGSGKLVYKWNTQTNSLVQTIQGFNSPQALGLWQGKLFVLNGSDPIDQQSNKAANTPFRTFKGGFAR